MISSYPEAGEVNSEILEDAVSSFELISQIRNLKIQNNISPKEEIELFVKGSTEDFSSFIPYVKKLASIAIFETTSESISEGISFLSGGHEFFIPVEGVNTEKEKEEISKEIEYARGFLEAVSRKLDNPKFVDNAPAKVVESERKKKSDAENKIKKLQDRLAEIG